MKFNFSQRKKSILSKQDKSSKGDWDKKIISLCEKINKKENFYTTSSCSGRIVLIIDKDKKEEGLFLKVWHDLIGLDELKKELNNLISPTRPPLNLLLTSRSQIDKNLLIENLGDSKIKRRALTKFGLKQQTRAKLEQIKFKQEPLILHVGCRTLEDSFIFLKEARLAGFKRSGIISGDGRFVVEAMSTEKLEFPIIKDNKLLVSDEFLKVVLAKSNENLKKGWKKIDALKKLI